MFDEHVVQLAWFLSYAVGGVRVVVPDCDSNVATEESREYFGRLRQGAKRVTVARLWPLVLLFSFFSGVPALIFGRRTATAATSAEPSATPNDGPTTPVDNSKATDGPSSVS